MIYQGKYPVKEVILHTSATSSWWWHNKTVEQMRDEIREWHVIDNGWKDIGYHFVVAPDGSWARGRMPTTMGAHVRERNRGTLGICLVPKTAVNKMGKFSDFYTVQQRDTVKSLIRTHTEGIQRVTGHNQYANKLCPGFKVNSDEWLTQDKPNPFAAFFAWIFANLPKIWSK